MIEWSAAKNTVNGPSPTAGRQRREDVRRPTVRGRVIVEQAVKVVEVVLAGRVVAVADDPDVDSADRDGVPGDLATRGLEDGMRAQNFMTVDPAAEGDSERIDVERAGNLESCSQPRLVACACSGTVEMCLVNVGDGPRIRNPWPGCARQPFDECAGRNRIVGQFGELHAFQPRKCRLMRASMADIPRRRSGLTASARPSAE